MNTQVGSEQWLAQTGFQQRRQRHWLHMHLGLTANSFPIRATQTDLACQPQQQRSLASTVSPSILGIARTSTPGACRLPGPSAHLGSKGLRQPLTQARQRSHHLQGCPQLQPVIHHKDSSLRDGLQRLSILPEVHVLGACRQVSIARWQAMSCCAQMHMPHCDTCGACLPASCHGVQEVWAMCMEADCQAGRAPLLCVATAGQHPPTAAAWARPQQRSCRSGSGLCILWQQAHQFSRG